jgi:outer membrane protein assembly factor BamB
MERALYSGSFDYASVTPSAIMLYRCRKEDGRAAKLLAIVPIAPQPHVSFDASVKQKGNDITIKANAPGNPALICRIDTQQFEGDVAPNKWIPLVNGELHLDASTLSPGLHSLFVRAQYALPAERASEFQDTEGGGDPWQKTLELRISSTAPRVVWSRKLGGMAQSRLLYNDGIVYVPCLDHKLYALDASTGKSRWKFKTGDLVYSTPEIEDGVLYFGSADHYVYALNPQTGKLIWKAETGGPVYASLKVGDGIACVGCGDEKAYGFDAKTGEQKWVAPLSGFVQAQAEFANDTFYLGAWDNTFYALDASTGQQRWTDHIGKRLFYSPAIARPTIYNDHIYVVSDDNTLHVLDLKTGHEDWTARCAVDDNRYGNSTPLILGDRLYLGCLGDGGVVDSLNAETGANIWTLRTGNDISDSSPISDGKRIYIGSVNGDFYCLDPATGAIQWTYHLGPGHLVATAATDGIDTAYIASMSDTVYALRTP